MDYRMAISCYQDKAGDEDAKINIFVNGSQVVTESVVTSTDDNNPSIITWESKGLDNLNQNGSVTIEIRFQLANNLYVDSDTDRNIHINGIGYIDKADNTNYKIKKVARLESDHDISTGHTVVSDFNDWTNYVNWIIPTKVVGDQIDTDFWDREGNTDAFYHIPVWGGDDGVTVTFPLTVSATHYVQGS